MIVIPPLALDDLRLPWIRLDCHVCRATGFLTSSVRRDERCWRCEGWGVIASRRVGPKQDAVTCSATCTMQPHALSAGGGVSASPPVRVVNSAGLEFDLVGFDPGSQTYTVVSVHRDHQRHYTDPMAREFAEEINAVGRRRGWR